LPEKYEVCHTKRFMVYIIHTNTHSHTHTQTHKSHSRAASLISPDRWSPEETANLAWSCAVLRLYDKALLLTICDTLARNLIAMDRDSLRQVHQFFTACDQVGLCVFVCVCARAHAHVCMHTHTQTHAYVCVFVHVYLYIGVHVHLYVSCTHVSESTAPQYFEAAS
jgi:hypothetical protein